MSITIRMSRVNAEERGLLVCQCGYPKNNHFNFGKKLCAHSELCKGYKEVASVGYLVKSKKKRIIIS